MVVAAAKEIDGKQVLLNGHGDSEGAVSTYYYYDYYVSFLRFFVSSNSIFIWAKLKAPIKYSTQTVPSSR